MAQANNYKHSVGSRNAGFAANSGMPVNAPGCGGTISPEIRNRNLEPLPVTAVHKCPDIASHDILHGNQRAGAASLAQTVGKTENQIYRHIGVGLARKLKVTVVVQIRHEQ